MPVCKKCNQRFPNMMKIDGIRKNISNRSYCLDCSPFGTHKFYKNRTNEERLEERKNKHRPCLVCGKNIAWYSKAKECTTCISWYRRYINRTIILKEKGGRCVKCGINDMDTLTLHHINEDNKSFTFAGNWNYSLDTLRIESQKCIILCANCHTKEHRDFKQDVINYYNNKSLVKDSNLQSQRLKGV